MLGTVKIAHPPNGKVLVLSGITFLFLFFPFFLIVWLGLGVKTLNCMFRFGHKIKWLGLGGKCDLDSQHKKHAKRLFVCFCAFNPMCLTKQSLCNELGNS